MKTKVVDRVMIETNSMTAVSKNQSIVKVQVFSSPARDLLCEFWIPTNTYLVGLSEFITAIKSRVKHDIKLEFKEYSLKEN